ncbi:unnamed protein product [Choristocarpus tenellus]
MASAAVATVSASAGDTLNQAWKNDKSKFGFRMLEKMGWKEGKGLGKNEDGMATHVKVAKKSNNLGLGAKRDSAGDAGWESTSLSFNSVLEALGKAYGNAPTKKKKASRKKEKRNKEKVEAVSVAKDSSAAVSTSGCPSRAKRIRSKDVRSFSKTDLRAILGHSAPSLPSNPLFVEPPAQIESAKDSRRRDYRGTSKKRRRSSEEGTSASEGGVQDSNPELERGGKEKNRKERKKRSRKEKRVEERSEVDPESEPSACSATNEKHVDDIDSKGEEVQKKKKKSKEGKKEPT